MIERAWWNKVLGPQRHLFGVWEVPGTALGDLWISIGVPGGHKLQFSSIWGLISEGSGRRFGTKSVPCSVVLRCMLLERFLEAFLMDFCLFC